MLVSPISVVNNQRFVQRNKINEPTQPKDQPSFKNYGETFVRYFEGSKSYASNSETFRALMQAAINTKGAVVDEIAQVFMKPGDYNSIINGFNESRAVYKDLNSICFERPFPMVRNNWGDPLVSIVNFGYQGGLLDLFTLNIKKDTRICFHGLGNYKDSVICLGRDNDGKDHKEYTSDGIGVLVAAIMTRNL